MSGDLGLEALRRVRTVVTRELGDVSSTFARQALGRIADALDEELDGFCGSARIPLVRWEDLGNDLLAASPSRGERTSAPLVAENGAELGRVIIAADSIGLGIVGCHPPRDLRGAALSMTWEHGTRGSKLRDVTVLPRLVRGQ